MSAVARRIDPSGNHCPQCGDALLVTWDAIGRPRERCPSCQGVVRDPMEAGVVAPLHRQTATCKAELAWSLASAAVRRCVDCAALLPAQATGRPRQRCANRTACSSRARGVA